MEGVKILTQNLVSLFSYKGGWIFLIIGIFSIVIGILLSFALMEENFMATCIGGVICLMCALTLFLSCGDKYYKIYEIVPLEDKLEIDISKYKILEYQDNGVIKIRDKALYDSKGNEIKED